MSYITDSNIHVRVVDVSYIIMTFNVHAMLTCSDCQRRDWTYHKSRCRGGRPTPVGLPFVVSLPASKLTYSRLAAMAEKFARSALFMYHYAQ